MRSQRFIELGGCLEQTEGWAHPQVAKAYEQAWKLHPASSTRALWGLATHHLVKSMFRESEEWNDRFREAVRGNVHGVMATALGGVIDFYRGKFDDAVRGLSQVVIRGEPDITPLHNEFGLDPIVVCRCYRAFAWVLCGKPESALSEVTKAATMACDLFPGTFTELFAEDFLATILLERRQWKEAADVAERVHQRAQKVGQGFYQSMALASSP